MFGAPWRLFPFERAARLAGLENLLTAMVEAPDVVTALLARLTSQFKDFLGDFLSATGDCLEVLMLGDDLGSERGLLVFPTTYRWILKPFHADLIAFARQDTRACIFFHSDGDVWDVIDDLVEIGVEILNPIQTTAGRMSDLVGLKKRFGQRLTF